MKPYLFLLSLFVVTSGLAQRDFWSSTSSKDVSKSSLMYRTSTPSKFDLYALDLSGLETTLNSVQSSKSKSGKIIKFPLPDGTMESFLIKEHSVFQAGLQAKYPNLRAYRGISINDSSTIVYFSVSPVNGLSAMMHSGKFGSFFIDAHTKDKNTYIAYQKKDLSNETGHDFMCEVVDTGYVPSEISSNTQQKSNDGQLRTYRLALASTDEYSQFHLDIAGIPVTDITTPDSEKKAVVLEAMMVSMVRVNGVYERDFAIRMVIIDNNDLIINVRPDVHANEAGPALLISNQQETDRLIGSANYDIGHIYSTGGGGVAGLGVPCRDGLKARGVTGLPQPINDPFWIDFVAHEMGHQYGGNHSYNNSCTQNRNNGTAVEPGSGSTIMAYAGICTPNVQNNSDDHFHAISIQEILAYTDSQMCESQSPTDNLAPFAFAPQDFTIPASTPFQLFAVGTDNDTDLSALTYNWEQMDIEIGEVMPPQPTNTVGPMFRSNSSLSSNIRLMPDMATVLAGLTANMWEVVPSVNRTMEFRVTVRDNELDGAGTAFDDVIVTVDASSGPFIVTSQNTSTTWEPNTTEVITWDVANTDQAPISTSTVNILFSNDGGLTYPTTLASNVANNGSANITVPNMLTSTGRVKVVPTNNHYYDVNDTDITIDGVLSIDDNLGAFENFSIYPNPSNGIFNIAFTPVTNDAINVSLYDIRGRLITETNFENNGTFNNQVDYSQASQGVYFVKVSIGSNQITQKIVIE